MKQRVISAFIALIICVPIIIYGGVPFYIGASLIGLIGFMELLQLRNKRKEIPYAIKIVSVISFVVMMMSNWDVYGSLYVFDYEKIALVIFLLIIPIVFYNNI